MPPKIKSEQEKLAIKTRIMDAARELFVTRGIEAVTMREVAKQIGYSATTIYLYFADKETLMRAVCDADFLKLADTLKGLLAITNPMQRLIAFGKGYVEFALTYPNHYRMMFMTAHPPCTPEVSQIQQNNAEQDAYFQLISVTQAAYESKVFRDEWQDPVLIAQTIWAAMHGLCALHITMAQDSWIDWRPLQQRVETMMLMTMQGMVRPDMVNAAHMHAPFEMSIGV